MCNQNYYYSVHTVTVKGLWLAPLLVATLEVGWLLTLSGRSYYLAAGGLAAGRPQGAGSGECYGSHSPNKNFNSTVQW